MGCEEEEGAVDWRVGYRCSTEVVETGSEPLSESLSESALRRRRRAMLGRREETASWVWLPEDWDV